MKYFQYLILIFVSNLTQLFNISFVNKVSYFIGIVFYYVLKKRRKLSTKNMIECLGFSEKKAKYLTKKVFINTARIIIEILYSKRIKQIFKDIEIKGLNYLDDSLKKGNGIILISGHIGNWEIEGEVLGCLNYPMYAVVKKQKNQYIDSWINRTRNSLNMKPLYKTSTKNGLKKIINTLKDNNIIAFLIDQYGGGKGLKVDFFRINTSTPTGPYRIAKITKAAVHPIYMIYENGNYKIRIFKEVKLIKNKNKRVEREENTQKFIKIIENIIRKYPSQWLWLHNRFKDKKC